MGTQADADGEKSGEGPRIPAERLKPWYEGVEWKGPSLDAQGRLAKYPLNFGNAESLRALSEDWTFFSPAALYLYGRFSDGLLVEYIHHEKKDIKFCFAKFQDRIFRGLETVSGDEGWNFALWAMHSVYWKSFEDFVCGITLHDNRNNLVIQYGMQEFAIVDPLVLARGRLTSTQQLCKIKTFGVNGTHGRAGYLQTSAFDQPRLHFYEPARDLKVFAKALQAGKNPHNVRELFRLQEQQKEQHEQGKETREGPGPN